MIQSKHSVDEAQSPSITFKMLARVNRLMGAKTTMESVSEASPNSRRVRISDRRGLGFIGTVLGLYHPAKEWWWAQS